MKHMFKKIAKVEKAHLVFNTLFTIVVLSAVGYISYLKFTVGFSKYLLWIGSLVLIYVFTLFGSKLLCEAKINEITR